MAMHGAEQRVIRTPDQRLRLFVSSTLAELSTERSVVRKVIERLRLTPVMFELGARPHPPRALYRTYLQQSHVFVAVYWQSYGWVAPGETVSGLEDEYLLSAGMPRLLYVKEPAPERQERLAALLRRIQNEDTATYKRFTSTEQLEQFLADDLMVLLSESFESATSAGHATAALELVPPPRPLTALLGRADDVAAVTRMIAGGARLVTLTGSGGIGKTRLAEEVGRELSTAFAEAVHFVSLADALAPSDVLARITSSLGLPVDSGSGLLEPLVRQLAGRRLLLVLDNFEQVIGASADVAALLDRCASLHVLVTSRQVLRLRGEREYRVGPLPLPDGGSSLEDIAGSPAVQLLVARAQEAQPTFVLSEDNAGDVMAICTRLDGVPLALELAAARIRLLPPPMLLARLTDRLDLIGAGPVDLPDRQRTLRATIDWSYELLDEPERALFARLSVFAGGFFIEAAEDVCGSEAMDVLETLTSLLDKSLVAVVTGQAEGQPRLRMLSAVRDYAAQRLDDRGEAAHYLRRHADYYLRLVDTYRDDLVGAAHAARSEQLDAEAENLATAVRCWTGCGDTSALSRFAWATFPHYWLRGQLRVFDDMLTDAEHNTDPEDPDGRLLLTVRGLVHLERGRREVADALADKLLASGATDDEPTTAAVLVLKAYSLTALGRPREGHDYAERGHRAAEAAGDAWLTAMAARTRGTAALATGDLSLARASFEQCADYARSVQHWPMLGASLGPLGATALRQGDLGCARAAFTEAAESFRRGRSREGLPLLLEQVAALTAESDVHSATEILAAADAIRHEMGIVIPTVVEQDVAALRNRLRSRLAGDFPATWQHGQQLTTTAALDQALQMARQPSTDSRPAGAFGQE
jgi:predicted ATPase